MSASGAACAELCIRAPAKINLGLAVLGKRPDGYHELRTIFQAVSLCDRLRLRRRPRGVSVRCPALPGLGEGNLAHRAASLFLRESGIRGGVGIDLEKRIPAGGGLGGGSSDAAAVLVGCCRLFGVRPPPERLAAWAAALGSDVPFFIAGGTAIGAGRGELLTPLAPWPGPVAVLIYAPERGIATAEVFRAFRGGGLTRREEAFTILSARWQAGHLGRFGAALFNDLERPAFSLVPELSRVKQLLRGAGAEGVSLTGSGSCIYGLFTGAEAAERARRALGAACPGKFFRVHFMPARRRWGVVKR